MFDNLRADFSRKRALYYSKKGFLKRYVLIYFQFGSMAVIVYRFGSWVINLRIPIIKHFLLFLYLPAKLFILIIAGVSIMPRTEIGKGFIIHNFSSIFIYAQKIGENCTVQQGVTIGNIKGSAHPPIIGNNVYFGAGSKALGDVTIGNNIIIGANSLVITSVPDNCTVVGVPARIVSCAARKSEYLKNYV